MNTVATPVAHLCEEESSALDNKDSYTERPKTGGDHSVELGQTVVCCILGGRPQQSPGY